MSEVGIYGPEDNGAIEVGVELADKSCRLCRCQAVLLEEREVGSALPKTDSMSGSISDIFDFNDGMSFLWCGGFLAVYVQGWPHWCAQGAGSLLLCGGIFLFSPQPALQSGDEVMDSDVRLLIMLLQRRAWLVLQSSGP